MPASVHKVTLIGRLGTGPETFSTDTESKIATFSLATNENWRDKEGGKQEKTDWHKIVIYSEPLVKVAESYLKKGSLVYLEGKTRNAQVGRQRRWLALFNRGCPSALQRGTENARPGAGQAATRSPISAG